VYAVRYKRFIEGVIPEEDDYDIYTREVPPLEDELKVTLVWDDVAGTAGAADILQNDLDLLLINPDGDEFFTPWELDPTNPDSPATRNSFATEALADGARDDVNVVEQVLVDNPDVGTWTIKVKGTEIPYPDQRYSLVLPWYPVIIKPPRVLLSIHFGYPILGGQLRDIFDPRFTFVYGDLEFSFPWLERLSAVLLAGFNPLEAKTPRFDDTYWINLNPNLKFQQQITGPWSAYAGAGPGFYIPKAGDNKFGFNAGGGIDYELNRRVTFEVGVDYHRIFDGLEVYDPTYTDDAQLLGIHGGVIVGF
jgi:hypothetical protein